MRTRTQLARSAALHTRCRSNFTHTAWAYLVNKVDLLVDVFLQLAQALRTLGLFGFCLRLLGSFQGRLCPLQLNQTSVAFVVLIGAIFLSINLFLRLNVDTLLRFGPALLGTFFCGNLTRNGLPREYVNPRKAQTICA